MSLPHQNLVFCQKHLEQALFYVIFFTHTHLMKRLPSMVNRIDVTTLTEVQFTLLLAKHI